MVRVEPQFFKRRMIEDMTIRTCRRRHSDPTSARFPKFSRYFRPLAG